MIQYPNIDPVAIQLGPLQVHWYGIMYLIGFSSAWLLGRRRCRNSQGLWNENQLSDLIFYAAIGVILGGRLGYVFFYHFDYFLNDPIWLFKIWEGGMSFHGGLIGVLIASVYASRKWHKSFFQVTDFVAPLVPLALGAGRLGNFIGSELWGRVSSAPWAMIFPKDPLQLPRHPSPLYQFALEGIILFLIVWFYSAKPKPRMAVSGIFVAAYGIFRFSVEFFRQPDEQLGFIAWNWLTMGQLLSLPMVLLGAGLLWYGYRQNPLSDGLNSDDRLWLQKYKAGTATRKERDEV